MVAGERTTLDDAYPGDIIGVINPSLFAIGDTLSIYRRIQLQTAAAIPAGDFRTPLSQRCRQTKIF